MLEIVFATTNKGKLTEVQTLVSRNSGISIVGLRDRFPAGLPEVNETGTTYEENCRIKAHAYFEIIRTPILADDSGIAVDALQGAPGVYAAEYAGKGAPNIEHIKKVWRELKRIKHDPEAVKATMHSYVMYWDGQKAVVATGDLPGRILFEQRGTGGFGYDTIFIPDGFDKTVSELKEAAYPIQTHRIKAMNELFEKLEREGIAKT